MRPYFERIGARIDAAWGRDSKTLPAIAAQVLSDDPAPASTSLADLLDAVVVGEDFPTQGDPEARFGDPPVTVWATDDLRIDVNLWVNTTTAIHQHAFAGAFQVLHGSSLHTTYDFASDDVGDLRLGALSATTMEVLRPGDVREILPGPELIHSLFHLDTPSATVVVRTQGERDWLPQLVYDPPGVGWNCRLGDVWSALDQRRAQVAGFLGRVDDELAGPALTGLLQQADPFTAYQLLSDVVARVWLEQGRPLSQVETALDWGFSLVDADVDVRSVLRDAALRRVVRTDAANRRALFDAWDDRLALAVLANATCRADIEAFYDDARAALGAFVMSASQLQHPTAGVNALGLDEAASGHLHAMVTEDLDLDGLIARLGQWYTTEQIEASRPALVQTDHQLRRLSLFAAWF